ncbi:MAG: hypothetical protein ACK5U4_16255, partial [Rhodospirillales bacterium]
MTDREPFGANLTVIDRTGDRPRILPQDEADKIAEMIAKPLTATQIARLEAYGSATDAYRAGKSIEEVVAAHPELDRDDMVLYLEGLIM